MRRLFAIIPSYRRWKLALLLGAFVGALAATGFGAYAAATGGNTINACAKASNGQLRLDTGGGCLTGEQAVQWNQTGPPGPQGPRGNTDSTVRHFSQFIFTGHTVTAPVVSAQGGRGKLSIFCGDDPSGSGGVGNISFATSNTSSTTEAITFVAPNIPRSSLQSLAAGGTATFRWDAPKYDNVSFEMMIEPARFPVPPGTNEDPELLDIRGFIQQFSFGCSFYVYMDASEVPAPLTVTP
jgi:hypothetical protein